MPPIMGTSHTTHTTRLNLWTETGMRSSRRTRTTVAQTAWNSIGAMAMVPVMP